jgi:cytochrome c oxidase assembly protein subunit 15
MISSCAVDRARHSFIRFAWITLGVTVAVILWGAVVRATGSGAGCGSHWPFCNGVVVPLAPATATIIEFTHRLTSGAAMILAVVLALWARRVFPAGHPARTWALWSLIFMLIEAAIGAGIVLLGLVEGNASALRAGYIAVHLTNTMFLMGAMTGTIRTGTSGTEAGTPRTKSTTGTARVLALALMIVVAAAGAVVALGDTLFPHASLAEGFAADLDPTSHFLIRLRLWHPILAVATSVLAVFSFRSTLVTSLVLAQVGLGVMNVLMLAPLALQMAHLLGSSILWIAMVWEWLGTDGKMTRIK